MGAYSPAPVVTPTLHAKVMREIILPTINGMATDGIQYTGFLYAGLMIGPDGDARTLEFNCRMGDPETQPIMMRLKCDFTQLLEAADRRPPRSRRGRVGSPHLRSASSSPRTAIPMRRARATSSPACRRTPTTA